MKLLLPVLLCFPIALFGQIWQPDAGLVASYTDDCTVTASSGTNPAIIIDGDDDTNWVSGAPFPTNFLTRPDQNIMLSRGAQYTTSSTADSTLLSDADLNTSTTLQLQGDTAFLQLTFDTAQTIRFLSTKLNAAANVFVHAFTSPTDSFLVTTHLPSQNFQWLRYELPNDLLITQISFRASSSFMLYEIGALSAAPKEYVTLDLGSSRPIGKVYARHWAGTSNGLPNAEKVELLISEDAQNWTVINTLIPDALPIIVTDLVTEQSARYLRFEYSVRAVDFLKVFCWEVDAYDENGRYGAMPAAQPNPRTIRELLGVSGIWGWGNNQYSDLLPPGQGAELYAPVATHGRNYHNMTWDVFDPDNQTDFDAMSKGIGTEVFPWLNWDREYEQWDSAGMDVQVSIQIAGFADTAWTNPQSAAYSYGFDYAQHFGFQQGVDLIRLLEVGNEPWNYDSTTYQQILHGMATGVKAADTSMVVIPCALQAVDRFAELPTAPFNNYIGSRIDPQTLPFLDGLNTHIYSYDNRPDGMRYASYPEHINSSMREILNLIRFRDANLPGKPIYCTEWGWDHPSDATESCIHDECVSEQAAAAYAIRGLLFLMRLGVEQATWYFYADTKNTSSLYTRSGLTGSIRNNFTKKDSYRAFESLLHTVGDKQLLSVRQEDDAAWVLVMGDTLQQPTHLIAWRPVEGDSTQLQAIDVWGNYIPTSATRLTGKTTTGNPAKLPYYEAGRLQLQLNSQPLVVAIDTCQSCPNLLEVSTRVFLEGTYEPTTQSMYDSLRQQENLPLSPPQLSTDALGARTFNQAVLAQAAVVDWTVVELWQNGTLLASRTGLLRTDGQVVDVDGESALRFYGFSDGQYDIVVRHRNHLPIRSALPILLERAKN